MAFLITVPAIHAEEDEPLHETMYILRAKEGVLKKDPVNFGHYSLEITEEESELVYFGDQPERKIGKIPLGEFIRTWQHSLKAQTNLPCVVISSIRFTPSSENGALADIVQVFHPEYNPSLHRVTFSCKPLHDFPLQAGTFEQPVLIFDVLDWSF